MQTTMMLNSSQQKALILKISILRDFIQNTYIIYTYLFIYLFIYLFACVAGGIVCKGNALATSGVTAFPNSLRGSAPQTSRKQLRRLRRLFNNYPAKSRGISPDT